MQNHLGKKYFDLSKEEKKASPTYAYRIEYTKERFTYRQIPTGPNHDVVPNIFDLINIIFFYICSYKSLQSVEKQNN